MKILIRLALCWCVLGLVVPVAQAYVVATGDKGTYDDSTSPETWTPASDFNTGSGGTSPWDNTSVVYVGKTGAGTVGITSDYAVSDFIIGLDSTGGGTLNVTGATLDLGEDVANGNYGDIEIGYHGVGYLNITNSTVNGNDMRFSEDFVDGQSTAVIDNSTVNLTGHFDVAERGTASVTIQNGSQVSATTGYVHVGRNGGSNGTLIVKDGSTFNWGSQLIWAGCYGEGNIQVLNGSTLDINGDNVPEGASHGGVLFGSHDYGTVEFPEYRAHGSLLVDNSTFITGQLTIADGGDAEVVIQNNSTASTEAHFTMAEKASSVASLTVDNNSTLTCDFTKRVANGRIGVAGDATVTVKNGSTFTIIGEPINATGENAYNNRFWIAQDSTARATITVDNATMRIDYTTSSDDRDIYVADAVGATAKIKVVNGGNFDAPGVDFKVTNGFAEIVVDGAGSTFRSKAFFLGNDQSDHRSGYGTLNVTKGGKVVTNHRADVMNYAGSTHGQKSVVTITGKNSSWTLVSDENHNSDYLRIGRSNDTGASQVFVDDDGMLVIDGARFYVYNNGTGDSEDSGLYLSGMGGLAMDFATDLTSSLDTFLSALDIRLNGAGFTSGSIAETGIYFWDEDTAAWADVIDGDLGTDYELTFDGTYNILTALADKKLVGDANGDNKVDGSDVTILANNWQKGVSDGVDATWDMGDFNHDGKVDGSDVTILANNWQQGVAGMSQAAVPEPSTVIMLLTMAGGFLVWRRRR